MKATHKTPQFVSMLFLLVVGLVFTGPVFGQVQEAWSVAVQTFHNPTGLAVDSAGNVYVSGYGYSSAYSAWTWETVKLSGNDGSVVWSAPFGWQKIAVDSADNVYVSGEAETVKLSGNNGNVLWSVPFHGYNLAVDSANNVYVSEFPYSGQSGGGGTEKLSGNNGSLVWSVPFGGNLAVGGAGHIYVSGHNIATNRITAKLSANNGSLLWSVLLEGNLAVDSAGDVYYSGYDSNYHGITAKLSGTDGSLLWSVPFGGGYNLAVDSANNVYVSVETGIVEFVEMGIVKLSGNDGSLLWSAPFGPSNLTVDGADNVYFSTSGGAGKLSGNDGSLLWSVGTGGVLAVDSSTNVYVLSYSGTLTKYLQTEINGLNPDSAVASSAGFTLTVDGVGFVNGATVQWNGEPRLTTFINDTQLTAEISSADLSTAADITVALVTVANPNGTITSPKGFTIISANVGTFQSKVAGSSEKVKVSTAPSEPDQSGVSAEATNNGDSEPITVTVANYSTNPTTGTIFDSGGGFLDLQVTGADASDTVSASFYYPSTITGMAEADLALTYFNGSGWSPVLSSGGIPPAKDTTDNLDDTVSGGRFMVLWDDTSTPKVTELSGTVFAGADSSKPAITKVTSSSGQLAQGTPVQLTVEYTASGSLDTHSFSFEWGDGTVDTVAPSVYGMISVAHTYSSAGVYTVTVSLTDGNQDSVVSKFEDVVVYDPNGGFVTGAGWINSPSGAYRANPTLAGKATFGFNSQYLKGASVPTGKTEFRLSFASFNFRSSEYHWLVVAGAKAQYKGSGTINGAGDYGFMLTATDGQLSGGGGVDKFRIKIWDNAADVIVYDNAYGSPNDLNEANPQVLAGGSIAIHKSK